MSLLCGLTGFHVQVVDETVVLPQFLLVEKIVSFVPRGRRHPCRGADVASHGLVIDVPVVRVQQVPQVRMVSGSSGQGC